MGGRAAIKIRGAVQMCGWVKQTALFAPTTLVGHMSLGRLEKGNRCPQWMNLRTKSQNSRVLFGPRVVPHNEIMVSSCS